MRIIFIFVVFLASVVSTSAQASIKSRSMESECLRVEVSPEKSPYKVGKKISMTYYLVNECGSAIYIPQNPHFTAATGGFVVEVTPSKGQKGRMSGMGSPYETKAAYDLTPDTIRQSWLQLRPSELHGFRESLPFIAESAGKVLIQVTLRPPALTPIQMEQLRKSGVAVQNEPVTSAPLVLAIRN